MTEHSLKCGIGAPEKPASEIGFNDPDCPRCKEITNMVVIERINRAKEENEIPKLRGELLEAQFEINALNEKLKLAIGGFYSAVEGQIVVSDHISDRNYGKAKEASIKYREGSKKILESLQ